MKKMGFLFSISLFWLVLSVLSDGINSIVLPARLLGAGGGTSATALGMLTFTGLLIGMLVQPVAGAWSDRLRPRWGRKGVLAVGAIFVLAALGIFGVSPSFFGLAAGYILIQITTSVVQAAQQGFIPDQVPVGDRGMASGIKSFMDIGGAMIGFVLLGQIMGKGQPGLAVLLMGGMVLAALGLTALFVRERAGPAGAGGSPARFHWSALRDDLRQRPQFVSVVISRFFFLLGTYAVGRFLLLFVASRTGLTPEQASAAAGNLLAGLALVTVLAAPLAGWAADRVGRLPLMLFGALVSAAGCLGYLIANNLGEIFWFGCLLSLGSAAFATANWAITADIVPKDAAARYFGIANIGTAGAAAAAGLFGPLVDGFNRLSPGGGFTALFIAAALAFGVCALSLRDLRSATGVREGPIAIPVTSGSTDDSDNSEME